ncbi:hydroxyacid dehydrogenase [Parenemella sanctibonifatiensis]|uniref:hydroxyacid dehydrogenase n=1 Tax=Parenemella sanctibonifatiensis TaxID=2016505 RepID=UPI0015C62C75|nr:hydroxyacid dehydrogenase [Parenemella sanctibonifatiensis]
MNSSPAPIILIALPAGLEEKVLRPEDLARLEALAPVERTPGQIDWRDPATAEQLSRAKVVVAGWGTPRLDADLVAGTPVELVAYTAGSIKAVYDPSLYAAGVRVTAQAGVNAVPVAEFTLGVILLALKDTWAQQRRYREARQMVPPHATDGIAHRTVGIIGASTIGRMVMERLSRFTLDLCLYDPYVDEATAAELGVTLVRELPDLMSRSDVVSLHAPWSKSTEGMVDAAAFRAMRDGATFINTARGALVDEQAMIAELQTGRFEAVLDVTWPEPPVADSPLWELSNVVLTPHIAGSIGTEVSLMGRAAVDDVVSFFRDGTMEREVPAARYDALA